jgi:CBS domain-containing protein
MKAGDVMTTGAATIRPEASLSDAAQLMVQNHISGLPVVDAQDRVIGLITEGDFLLNGASGKPRLVEMLVSAGPDGDVLKVRKVADLMTRDPVTISVDVPIEAIIELMLRHNIRRLPVTEQGKVVGIVSRGNLLSALLRRSQAPRRP